jgi:eukaryotic-like serine/threonine-protein kinase
MSDAPDPPEADAGRYAVEDRIGRGGMATVWRARDRVLDREVALKRLRPAMREDPEAMARFVRETRTVARLSHPGIVKTLDGGEDADGPFLVMELIDGEDLKTRIRRDGALAPREAARIGAQVAATLEFTHRHGVVHRDIKSQNVLIDRDGNAKLADFGIAHLLEGAGESRLTRSGMMVGTSDYLAPEQAEGRPIDGRTDIYALGIVLWECLTGELPFPAENFVAVAMRQVSDPLPDPRERAPGVSPRLAACVLRAAAKDPDDRFPDAAAFADELAACAEEEPGPADRIPPPPSARAAARAARRRAIRRRRLTALAVVVVIAVLVAWGLASLLGAGGSAAPQAVRLPVSVSSYDPQGDGTENAAQVSRATDGRPGTAWYTEQYGGSAAFGGAKQGVGLLVAAPAGSRPEQVMLRSPTPGAQVQIRRVGHLSGAPLVATTTLTGADQVLQLPSAAPADLVVWIVRLVPDPNGAGTYWAGISEVGVSGTPAR